MEEVHAEKETQAASLAEKRVTGPETALREDVGVVAVAVAEVAEVVAVVVMEEGGQGPGQGQGLPEDPGLGQGLPPEDPGLLPLVTARDQDLEALPQEETGKQLTRISLNVSIKGF